MISFEKKLLLTVVVCLVFVFVGIARCNSAIEEAGGVKNIIIQGGKELKDIKRKIDEEQN